MEQNATHSGLTPFEQLEILRQEIGTREAELREADREIREIRLELERRNWLQTLHPFFKQLPAVARAAELPQIQAQRDMLNGAVEALRNACTALESALGPQAASAADPDRTAPNARRAKFDSFEDFRAKREKGF
jgi:hypothetical protein